MTRFLDFDCPASRAINDAFAGVRNRLRLDAGIELEPELIPVLISAERLGVSDRAAACVYRGRRAVYIDGIVARIRPSLVPTGRQADFITAIIVHESLHLAAPDDVEDHGPEFIALCARACGAFNFLPPRSQEEAEVWPGRGRGIGSFLPCLPKKRCSSSYVIGNATHIAKMGSNPGPGYVFARLPEDCGTSLINIWTRWRLLRHITILCIPPGLPPFTLACADGSEGVEGGSVSTTISGFLDDYQTPEVYDLRNLTIKGALDMCAPQSRGFNWTIELVDQKNWQVMIYSLGVPGGPGAIPSNSLPKYIGDVTV